MRRLRGRHDLLHRCVFLPVGDIVEDRPVEHPGVLQHHRAGSPDALPRAVPDLFIFNENEPLVRVVEPHQKIDDRGLAGPRVADDRDHFSGLRPEGEVTDDRPVLLVAEFHVLHADISVDIPKRLRANLIRHLLLLVEEVEDALRGRERREEFVDDVRDLVDRPRKFPRVEHKRRDIPQRDQLVHVKKGAQNRDDGERDVVDRAHRRADRHRVVLGVVVAVGGIFVDLPELLLDIVLVGVGLDRRLPGHHLLDEAVHDPIVLRALNKPRLRDLPHPGRIDHRDRDREEHDRRERHRDVDHHEKCTHNRHRAGQDLRDVGRHAGPDHVDVVGDAAYDVAGLIFVEETDGQAGELMKDIVSHFPHEVPRDRRHGHADEHREDRRGPVAEEHPDRVIFYRFKVHFARTGRRGVDRPPGKRRPQQREHVRDNT